jgi:SAM-dependent methyltransferase
MRYYEKYDWRYIGDFAHQSGVDARVYEADALCELEEMSEFFNTRADTYDNHMLDDLGLDEFYEAISACFDAPVKHLLDLGCGTGLELERLYKHFPDMEVTGIDMSAEMMKLLELKYSGKKLRLICGSYFDEDFGGQYDHVLSTYSFHHFNEESKLGLYQKIYAALEPGGMFIFGDYTVSSLERQQELLTANDTKHREQGIAEGEFYHFDTPFTAETEMKLMKAAGFAAVKIIRQWENTTIIIAKKREKHYEI